MNKSEVSEYLGVSKRQVEKLVASGKLAVVYEMIDGRKTAIFNRSEVEAYKEQRDTPVHRSSLSPLGSGEFGDSSLVRTGEFEGEPLFAIIEKLLQLIDNSQQSSPLANYRELEEAENNGWILGTSTVQQLTGVRPKGDCWEWGCFSFARCGKLGREAAWKVGRL